MPNLIRLVPIFLSLALLSGTASCKKKKGRPKLPTVDFEMGSHHFRIGLPKGMTQDKCRGCAAWSGQGMKVYIRLAYSVPKTMAEAQNKYNQKALTKKKLTTESGYKLGFLLGNRRRVMAWIYTYRPIVRCSVTREADGSAKDQRLMEQICQSIHVPKDKRKGAVGR